MSSGYKPISSPPVEVGWSASLEKTLDTLSKSWPEVALKVGEFLKKVDRFLIEIIDRELVLAVLVIVFLNHKTFKLDFSILRIP